MKKLAIALAPLLATACTGAEVATTGASVAGLFLGARPVASTPALNQRELDSANKRAKDAYVSVRMASRRGAIPPTQNQDTARPNFCAMVVADLAVVSDAGGMASALICRIDHHLDRAQAALENGLAPAYAENLAKADNLTDQLTEIIRKADEGAPQ
jgi:hypothetical protein